MKVHRTIDSFQDDASHMGKPLALVPTMGSLHAGHISIIEKAVAENASSVVSIFVNPSQFGRNEDYASYPRDIETDLAKLEKLKVDLVFAPTAEEMYPPGFATWVDVGHISQRLEGKSRPGHFKGVSTVVSKLLAIVRPNRAYFGLKDIQQLEVVKRLNADLNLGAEIIVCPTVREPDGLALSSRNKYLTPDERKSASVLYQSLLAANCLKTNNVDEIRNHILEVLSSEPLAKIDYISVSNPDTLEELTVVTGKALVSVAVCFGATRLIDNLIITQD